MIFTLSVDGDGLLTGAGLAAAPRLVLWRAPTDNDRIGGFADRWIGLGLDRLERRLVGADDKDGSLVVTADVVTAAGHIVRHVQTLTPVRDGVLVEELAVLPPELDDVPRVGTVFEVRGGPATGHAQLFGGGPTETYPDRRAAADALHRILEVDRLFTPYVRPQESGGRHGVRWFSLGQLEIADEVVDGRPQPVARYDEALVVHLDEPRQVSLTRYHPSDLTAATHSDELVPRDEVVVHIDAAHRGLGTASCGPDTLADYLLHPGEYRWSYTLVTPTD